jgi:hypothetical protein
MLRFVELNEMGMILNVRPDVHNPHAAWIAAIALGNLFVVACMLCMATPHCRIVFWQLARRPASRAD